MTPLLRLTGALTRAPRRRRWARRVTRSLYDAAVMLAIASGGIAFAIVFLHHSALRGS